MVDLLVRRGCRHVAPACGFYAPTCVRYIATSSNTLSSSPAIGVGTAIPTPQVMSSTHTTHPPAVTIQAPTRLLPVGTAKEVILSAAASLQDPEVTASAAWTPVQAGYSLTPAISRTTSSTKDIQSQLLQFLLSTAGGGALPSATHGVNALRIARAAFVAGLACLNPTTHSLLQGL